MACSEREWQRPQPPLRDLAAALGAVAVLAGLEPHQRFPDPLERLTLHLDQGDLDVLLDLRLSVLGVVETACRPSDGRRRTRC